MTTPISAQDKPVQSPGEKTPEQSDQPALSWSAWGDDAVPLHDAARQTEEREREARLHLVTGQRR